MPRFGSQLWFKQKTGSSSSFFKHRNESSPSWYVMRMRIFSCSGLDARVSLYNSWLLYCNKKYYKFFVKFMAASVWTSCLVRYASTVSGITIFPVVLCLQALNIWPGFLLFWGFFLWFHSCCFWFLLCFLYCFWFSGEEQLLSVTRSYTFTRWNRWMAHFAKTNKNKSTARECL